MNPTGCSHEVATWFLRRGYVVAFPLRRGYGANGGRWAEEYGRCDNPDFARGGLATAADIDAAIRHLHTLAFVRPKGTIVVGQSAGGWGTVAYASAAPAAVAAFVNFAGGRGGWAQGRANTNCAPAALVKAAGAFGRTARAPMLWIYTENDTFFAPEISKAMHGAFVAAGGKAELRLLPAFGTDGHNLFFGRDGSRVWGSVVEPFLAANGTAD
ncbi:MAG: prolyl oligopeptidase family serine peptidase [Proteobacteria bacterium]|nr:prolyl oligopeptidase family serine peptidase [Pseudomonadota bacterium]